MYRIPIEYIAAQIAKWRGRQAGRQKQSTVTNEKGHGGKAPNMHGSIYTAVLFIRGGGGGAFMSRPASAGAVQKPKGHSRN